MTRLSKEQVDRWIALLEGDHFILDPIEFDRRQLLALCHLASKSLALPDRANAAISQVQNPDGTWPSQSQPATVTTVSQPLASPVAGEPYADWQGDVPREVREYVWDIRSRLAAAEGERDAKDKQLASCYDRMDKCESRESKLREALNRTAYALFQIKRMQPDAIRAFASAEHSAACLVIDDSALPPAPEEGKGE